MNAARENPLVVAHSITTAEVQELANAVELLDWIKNRLPDASPEKAEGAVKVARCHAVLERVLESEAWRVYGPAEPEEETHL